jgi:hypothetical protein
LRRGNDDSSANYTAAAQSSRVVYMIGILQFRGEQFHETQIAALHTSALMVRGPRISGVLWSPHYYPLHNAGENFIRLNGYWHVAGIPLAERDPAILATAREGEKLESVWMDFFPVDLELTVPPWAHELIRSIRAAQMTTDQRAAFLLFATALARIAPSAENLIQMTHAVEGRANLVDSRLAGLAFLRIGGE